MTDRPEAEGHPERPELAALLNPRMVNQSTAIDNSELLAELPRARKDAYDAARQDLGLPPKD